MAISRLQSVLTYGIYICCVNCEQSNYQTVIPVNLNFTRVVVPISYRVRGIF